MKVIAFPSDESGCGYYRLRWVAEELRARGAEVSIGDSIPAVWMRSFDGSPPRCVGANKIDADVAVFQRVFRREILTVIRSLQEQGVKCVVDIDDDFSALSTRHPVYRQLHPALSPDKSWAVLAEAVKVADLVTVSTPALQARYGGRVIRNCVPRAYLEIQRQPDEDTTPVIGWTGTPASHPGDLEVVGDAVAKVCASGLARFRAIGDRQTLEVLGVPEQEFQPGLNLANFDYAHAVAQLDIGIVPLDDGAFNRAKSWLKGLEYAALGVPFVASPLPEYTALHDLAPHLSATRPRHWQFSLAGLVTMPEWRALLAEQGRMAAADLTIEGRMADEVLDAWTKCCAMASSVLR